ncbi:MAG: UbiA family prenyltransferase [Candidatus Omnitrophica bacterium]|nr:UbiA family prenyltransferase [Candidatus Omnitrophota bacterium]
MSKQGGLVRRAGIYWELMRPFTLLAPTVGFLSGAAIAARGWPPAVAYLGAFSAVVLNAASNIINQIYDLEIDRINKPKRPLPMGQLSLRQAWIGAAALYLFSWGIAALVPNRQFLWIVLLTTVITYAYSGPPLRTKRFGIWANVTIAIPRGCLLMVAGWTAVETLFCWEPWYVGMIFGLYILGAASTKDFADIEGDRAHGCRTLPMIYGPQKTAWIMAPFFVVPFLLAPLGAWLGILKADFLCLLGAGFFLSLWGVYVSYLILRKPEELATEANHVSWKHMYLLMVVGQIAIAAAYFC